MLDYEGVIEYCVSNYGSEPDHPWAKHPDYTVLRHTVSGKWYALVMNVPANKLGLTGTDTLWVLNIKCDPVLVQGLLQREGFLPAYHMSKTCWISALLDGTVPDDELKALMDASYTLTK